MGFLWRRKKKIETFDTVKSDLIFLSFVNPNQSVTPISDRMMIIQFFLLFHLNQQIDLNKVVFQTFLLPFFSHKLSDTLLIYTSSTANLSDQATFLVCLSDLLTRNIEEKFAPKVVYNLSGLHILFYSFIGIYDECLHVRGSSVSCIICKDAMRTSNLILSHASHFKASMNAVFTMKWRRWVEWREKKNYPEFSVDGEENLWL